MQIKTLCVLGGLLSLGIFSQSTTAQPIPGEGGTNTGSGTVITGNTNRNLVKYNGQVFYYINTNSLPSDNPELYNALLTIPSTTETTPSIKTSRYADSILLRLSGFDYSSETHDLALIISDNVAGSTWKDVKLSGSSDTNDGWIIQGIIPRSDVTDPMYLMVTNVPYDCSAFFKVVPYSGPQITVTGVAQDQVVSNLLTVTLSIQDLSGATNQHLTVSVDEIPLSFSLGQSNTVTIDTRYVPNGPYYLSFNVATLNGIIWNPTNADVQGNMPLTYDTTIDVALDFENQTWVEFAGDYSEPAIGTNYSIFGITPPKYISATIKEPTTGRVIRSFSGYCQDSSYVEIDWNFTDTNNTSAYTNDSYVLTFNASPTQQSSNGTTLTLTNTIARVTVRPAGWVISSYEEMPPAENGAWINSNTGTDLTTDAFMFGNLYFYNSMSQSLYFSYQIGVGRNTPSSPAMPLVLSQTGQAAWYIAMHNALTNVNYSDFNWIGHGNAYTIGGGEYELASKNYINTNLDVLTVGSWARSPGKTWKFRKGALWSCYSARKGQAGATGPMYLALGFACSQNRHLAGKNCELAFNEEVYSSGYAGSQCISKVALYFDTIWTMGANPYPGGASPNYSMWFALAATRSAYPEIDRSDPVLIGCPKLPFAGVYDSELSVGDYHQVVH